MFFSTYTKLYINFIKPACGALERFFANVTKSTQKNTQKKEGLFNLLFDNPVSFLSLFV
jgi:hypothetical protein